MGTRPQRALPFTAPSVSLPFVCGETEELGFEAIGLAIAALADEEELFASLGSLREEQVGWRRVSHRFLARVPITALPELIDSAELRLDDGEEVLERRFAAEEAWSGDEAEALGRLLVWGGPRFFGHKHQGQVSRVAAEFPQEALSGARAGEGEETRDLDLLWLDGLPLETLRAEATGVLAEPLGRIVERREWQQQHLEEPVPAPAEEEAEDTGAVLSTQLSEGRIAEDRVPSAELLWGLGSEPPEVREQIGELAEVWYSDYGRSGVRHEGNRVIFSTGLRLRSVNNAGSR